MRTRVPHFLLAVGCILGGAGGSGCVTQGTYDALKADHERTQGELSASTAAGAEKDKAIDGLKRSEVELKTALELEKARAKELEQQVAALNSERATALKDKSKLQASIAEMTAALTELQRRREAAEARVAEYKGLLDRFKSLIDAGKLTVKIVDGRMVVVLATDVLFASGSATLSKDGKAAILQVASLLASIPKRSFQVEGHTDNVPIATAQYPSNWELASARAINVVKAMIEGGMPAARISAASFGESKPSVPNDTPVQRAANRRIEIIIVPDLSTLPGFDELNKLEKSS